MKQIRISFRKLFFRGTIDPLQRVFKFAVVCSLHMCVYVHLQGAGVGAREALPVHQILKRANYPVYRIENVNRDQQEVHNLIGKQKMAFC